MRMHDFGRWRRQAGQARDLVFKMHLPAGAAAGARARADVHALMRVECAGARVS